MSDSRQIPKGWSEKRLRDVAEVNPPRPKVEDDNLWVSFIRMEDVSENAKIVGGSIKPYFEVSKGYTAFQEGDLLIAKITPCFENGKGALAQGLSNGIGFGSTEFHILRAKSESDVNFLYYITLSHEFRGYGELNMHGSAGQKRVPTDFIRNYRFLCPPLSEQRAIATILGTWDRAIALTERRLAAAEQRKQALMQQLLSGRVRFPEFAGEEWREITLKQVARLTAGGTPSTLVPEYWNGDIRWMKSGEVHLKRVYEVEGRITRVGLDNSSAKLIPENSVLIALAGQGITRGTVAINKVELSTNQSIAAIMPDSNLLYYEYLFYNLDARYAELRRLSSGEGGRGGLNLQLLSSLKIMLPCISEQRRIAAVLNACDRELDLLRRKRDALQQQKKGLMQRLLTGRVRVGPLARG